MISDSMFTQAVRGLTRAALSLLISASLCWGFDVPDGLYPTYSTASRLTATDADKKIVSVSNLCDWINGAAGRVVCTDDLDGTVTIDVDESGLDHNQLNNATVGDAHTQYALLAGRATGQTLIGGTAASDNLTLQSTSHATKGKILFGTSALMIQSDGKVGINETSPSAMLHTKSASATDITEITQGAAAQSANLTEWQDSSGNVLTYIGSDGEIAINQDSKSIKFGAGQDAGIWYDGSNMHIDAQLVGSGTVILNNLPTSDPGVAGGLYNSSGTLMISAGP